ncbi:MAG TPA: uroporphyrinogen-III C-methyltransferase [Sulfurivirga caldicuralii]|nr:uroporphyrinogen-III C-methyltransferase [Sulfurivirga caldicuralii]
MDALPIFVLLRQRPCWVIGGGVVAARKASLLLQAGAQVHVIAPALGQEMHRYVHAGQLHWHAMEFDPNTTHSLPRPVLIISATDDEQVSHNATRWAREQNILINTADVTELCDFILPAIVERGPITLAVSTGGRSPILARWIKGMLERCLPQGLGQVAHLLGQMRTRVKTALPTPAARKAFWERLLTPAFIEQAQDNPQQAQAHIEQALKQAHSLMPTGEVWLIGCGPGDPELLTLKAHRLLQQADVLLYDRLVDNRILDMARREAERIYVGKHAGDHALSQEQINALMIQRARAGQKVARLKGGDVYLFGRGGEEAHALAEAAIPFIVVPGLTTAVAVSAAYGIPLTHRDHAQAVTLITGHSRDGGLPYNWGALVQPNHTLVVYMGLKNLPHIRQALLDHGMDPHTPVALIENATRPDNRLLITDLAHCVAVRDQHGLKPPTLIIIGQVVKLHQELNHVQTLQ